MGTGNADGPDRLPFPVCCPRGYGGRTGRRSVPHDGRRLDDPAALAEACTALERQLSLSPDISAAASLLEGLGALLMLTEEGVVLNCA